MALETSFHSLKVTIWYDYIEKLFFGPLFFENIITARAVVCTVNARDVSRHADKFHRSTTSAKTVNGSDNLYA